MSSDLVFFLIHKTKRPLDLIGLFVVPPAKNSKVVIKPSLTLVHIQFSVFYKDTPNDHL